MQKLNEKEAEVVKVAELEEEEKDFFDLEIDGLLSEEVYENDAVETTETTEDKFAVDEEFDKEPVAEEVKAVKVIDRTVVSEVPVYEGKEYIVTGNIKGYAKGSVFSGTKEQIIELLGYKVITPKDKLTKIEKFTLGVK